MSTATPRRPDGASRSSPTMTTAGARRPTAHAAGIEIAAVIELACRAAGRIQRARHQGDHRRARLARAWQAWRRSHRRDRERPHDDNRVRCARGIRRLESGRASDLPSRRQAGVDRGDRRVHAWHNAARHARRRRGERRAHARPMSHRRHGGRRDGGGRVRLPDGLDRAAARERRARERSRRSGM